jgi:hypothetical protein
VAVGARETSKRISEDAPMIPEPMKDSISELPIGSAAYGDIIFTDTRTFYDTITIDPEPLAAADASEDVSKPFRVALLGYTDYEVLTL